MNYPFDYFLIALLIVLLILISSQTLERVIKIIIWNYILIAISLGISSWAEFLKYFVINLQLLFNANILPVVEVINTNKVWITIAIYFLILVLIMTKSKISIGNVENKIKRTIFKIILSPLSVIITLVALEVVIFGNKIFDINALLQALAQYKVGWKLYYFSVLTPLWIITAWLITIIFSLQLELKFSFKKSSHWWHSDHWWDHHEEH